MKSWMRLLAQQQGPETYSFVRREKGAVGVGGSGGQKKTGRGGGAVLVKLHGETHEGLAVLGCVGWDGGQFDVSGPELGKEFSFDIDGRGNRDVVLGGKRIAACDVHFRSSLRENLAEMCRLGLKMYRKRYFLACERLCLKSVT